MASHGIIDTHAHIIDMARFPMPPGPGYKPKPEETGTAEMFTALLDANGVRHGLLVQLSGYGFDNASMLDAMERYPGRFKAIAQADPETPERELADLARHGIVGVRFNLVSYRRDGLSGPGAERFLGRLKALGWFAQIFADDDQWPDVAPLLRRSGVKVLVDHFGVRNVAAGAAAPGFQAVLALGGTGKAAVKISAPFRMSKRPDFSDLDPYAAALKQSFGIENCIWGSDWPFVGVAGGFRYEAALAAVDRWLDGPAEREQVLWHNPARLLGFKE